ncbi:MAG: long-chain fatty acid--CoA ligase [Planctomycetota bacterium]
MTDQTESTTDVSSTPAPPETPDHAWLSSYPEGVDWSQPVDTTDIVTRFNQSVARFGDHTCIEFLGKSWTYKDVDELIGRAATGLQDLGVGPGTRVGLFLPNTHYYVIFFQAVLRCGATVVNFNPLYAKDEVQWQIRDSGTTVMVTLDVEMLWQKVQPRLDGISLQHVVLCKLADALPFPKNVLMPIVKRSERARKTKHDKIVRFEDLLDVDELAECVDVDPEDTAVFQYTGGTTGRPKAAMLSHRALGANIDQVHRWMPDLEMGGEAFLGVLPLSHVFAMTVVMNLALSTGSRILLLPKFDLGEVLGTIHKQKPTIFPGVPAIYGAINESRKLSKYDLSSLKFCISGGAPLPVEVRKRFIKVTGCRLVEGYGLSECAPVATCNPLVCEGKDGTIGQPLPGTTVEIRSVDDPRKVQPIGEAGEVCIAGPQLMQGYWQRPEETADTIRRGFLHTGDIGIMDSDGFVRIVDRIKDVILRGGYNVYPRMIEEAIYQHPFVAEACVIGIESKRKGEVPKAFVRLEEGASLTQDDLLEFLEEKISRLEMPKEIEFRTDPLPKTTIGKPSRKALRDEETMRREEAS